MHSLRSLLLVAALASPALAQTAPGFCQRQAPSTFWNFNNVPFKNYGTGNTGFGAISAQKLASNAPGEWTVCLTVRFLRPSMGGVNFGGLLMGTWNPNRKTPFVPNGFARALNSGANEYGLHVEPARGRYAVFDRFLIRPRYHHIGVWFASRPDANSPFGTPVRIDNVKGLTGWADPSLGYVNGKLKLFYGGHGTTGNNRWKRGIVMIDLDISNPQKPFCFGKPELVAAPVPRKNGPSWVPHSPTPIVGKDGDVEGLWMAEYDPVGGKDSDMYFADDLDPATPHRLAFDTTGWLNGGAVMGGTFLCADSTDLPSLLRLREAKGAWAVGDVEPKGATVDVTVGAFSPPGRVANAFLFLTNQGLLRQPITIGGFCGQIGINPLVGFSLPATGADQRTSWSLRTPNNPSVVGKHPIQSLTFYVTNRQVNTLTNTATIEIR